MKAACSRAYWLRKILILWILLTASPLLAAPAPESASSKSASLAEMTALLDELEAEADEGFEDEASKEIHVFRRDRLLDDLVHHLAGGDLSAEAYSALGRVLELRSQSGHQSAAILAVELLAKAAELAPDEADAPLRLAQLSERYGRHHEAERWIAKAKEAKDAGDYPTIDLREAEIMAALGEAEAAQAALERYRQNAHSDDTLARASEQIERTLAGVEGMHLLVEGKSMVDAQIKGSTWLLQHYSLGFAIGLPLSWQLGNEDISAQGGVAQITAPPVQGAEHQWRSDELLVWVMPLEGHSLDEITEAYLGSYSDISSQSELEPLLTLKEGEQRRLRLRREPFMEAAVEGQATILTVGESAVVLEFWGDEVSYYLNEGQLEAILPSFSSDMEL